MKVVLYCPIQKNLEMFKFSSEMALENSGTFLGAVLKMEKGNVNDALTQTAYGHFDFEFAPVVDSSTEKDILEYIRQKGWNVLEVKEEKSDNWLVNLYRCWNRGYDAFKELGADIVVPMGSDHAFFNHWLYYLIKYSKPNRIVNCKLIESGKLPSIHECYDFGTVSNFKSEDFLNYCEKIWKDELITNESFYGRRLDAMPFACPKDVWEKFGPMIPINNMGITGDTDFFNRCKAGGVEITKSLGSISYHIGAETTRTGR